MSDGSIFAAFAVFFVLVFGGIAVGAMSDDTEEWQSTADPNCVQRVEYTRLLFAPDHVTITEYCKS